MDIITDPRTVLAVTGEERLPFLQNLVTNDLRGLASGPVYAALLTPQGKYLADFFLLRDGDRILLDVATPLAEGLARRLTMYKLRAAVGIEETGVGVSRGTGDPPEGAVADPRDAKLPWRLYGERSDDHDPTETRVEQVVPLSGVELVPDDSYILEMGFERLRGVDFRKGCYVGQEVTARMKHKTELRKGLVKVAVEGEAPVGQTIESDGKVVGSLFSQAGGFGLAYLRFDRAQGELTAGSARMTFDQ